MVVPVGFNAFLSVLFLKPIILNHTSEQTLIDGHFLITRKQSLSLALWHLFVPRMHSDIFYFKPVLRICLENALDHLFTISR